MSPLNRIVTTYYVRDPQGDVLAVYEHKHGDSDNGTFTLAEQHLYGAGRLGMKKRDLALNVANASEPTPVTHYELTNHLGNVMAVISDKASTTNEPTVVSLSDYYPFGMTEPGRSYTRPGDDYRFGYTGHEKENDLAEGVYTTEYRLLDTRLGRWLSVDPLFGKYPDMSSYNYCGGSPMMLVDPNGEDAQVKIDDANKTITITARLYVLPSQWTNQTVANQYKNKIMSTWGSIKQYESNGVTYDLKWDVDVICVKNGDVINDFNGINNYITPFSGLNSRGHTYAESFSNSGEWRVTNKDEDSPAAHEFGHIMGLRDRYFTYKDLKDFSLLKPYIGKPYKGWKGNIMSDVKGNVTNENIKCLLDPIMEKHKEHKDKKENSKSEQVYQINSENREDEISVKAVDY